MPETVRSSVARSSTVRTARWAATWWLMRCARSRRRLATWAWKAGEPGPCGGASRGPGLVVTKALLAHRSARGAACVRRFPQVKLGALGVGAAVTRPAHAIPQASAATTGFAPFVHPRGPHGGGTSHSRSAPGGQMGVDHHHLRLALEPSLDQAGSLSFKAATCPHVPLADQ